MVLYIILGILVGVPVYLLLNTVLGLIIRPFAALCVFLYPGLQSTFMNEMEGGTGSLVKGLRKEIKVVGWLILVATLCFFVIMVIYRFFWGWIKVVKFCWNLGTKTKTQAKTK